MSFIKIFIKNNIWHWNKKELMGVSRQKKKNKPDTNFPNPIIEPIKVQSSLNALQNSDKIFKRYYIGQEI
ncbi:MULTISPECIES: hypothetical protein [Bacillaceae]|uniref:hypothetical protein n=1 Tax=Bacillaceae TaxID=186817 RepID=UPI00066052A6|nr:MULTISPECIES: hypothetical protein [Bacillaceae]MCF2650411.1 hypothetical protein [Niallia circulans]